MPLPSRFTYHLHSARIVFGAGALHDTGAELGRAGFTRAFVVTTPGRSGDLDRLRASLGDAAAGIFDRAQPHVPGALVAAARAAMERVAPDCCVSLGGGSATGLGKAIALHTGLPLIAIPTTYAGSEMTDLWGITDDETKTTGRNTQVAPKLVVYDPELTLTLPPLVSAASGLNAIAHAVEALYAPDANPLASLLAENAIGTLARVLPGIMRAPHDYPCRTEALRAAHFAGLALGATSMGLHHKLCHVLGGLFGLPHAPTHAALLPYTVAYNREAAADAIGVVAAALQVSDAAAGLHALNRELGLTATLRDLGLHEGDIDRAAGLAAQSRRANPRTVTRDGVRAVLTAAWAGAAPDAVP